ncbi:MAG: TetR/AcrR family transcriptional regulator [Actinomycetota bacterium]|nr:TetR/AcrR family transcriptional regulator [Actinomycetota bacterium]
MAVVKTRRPYDSRARKEQAARNRDAALDAAERLFLERGYAGTSIASIAQEAGLSVQTIYKVFGSKSGLVKAIYLRGLLGKGDVPAYERSDAMREREVDPRKMMREWGALTTEVASVVSPIRLLMRSAALADREMEALLRETDEDRLERMRHHARFLKERGYLREGVTLGEATDVLWTCSSVEIYDLLVVQRGWTLPRFSRFVADFMITALLPPE